MAGGLGGSLGCETGASNFPSLSSPESGPGPRLQFREVAASQKISSLALACLGYNQGKSD